MNSAPLLAVNGLCVSYGGVMALHDADLSISPNQIVGLIGPNGAGKTTFIDAVSGFTKASGGSIQFEGRVVDDMPAHRRSQAGIGRTFQSLELFDDLTVIENLLVATHKPSVWSTITDAVWRKRHQTDDAEACLEIVGLSGVGALPPVALSNGARHLVTIARALAGGPRLLMLDEPAAGLDSDETAKLATSIRRIRERGTSILLVDHDMSLVLDVCDVVYVLDYGRVIASGPPASVRDDAAVIEAYLGQASA